MKPTSVTNPSKKRRRSVSPPINDSDGGTKRTKKLAQVAMKGKLLAVSTRLETSAKATLSLSEDETTILSYNQLKDLVSQSGAQVSSQVHKKVYAVVASHEAVQYPATQRVRKAWKLKIPVVNIQWIRQCIKTRRCVSLDESFCYPPQSPPETLNATRESEDMKSQRGALESRTSQESSSKSRTSQESSSTSKLPEEEEVVVDLGCCCICHDSAAPGEVTDCAWCVDCSVNKAAQAILNSGKQASASIQPLKG